MNHNSLGCAMIFAALALIGFLLSSCGKKEDQPPRAPEVADPNTQAIGPFRGGYATEFALKDGTRCVATVQGGITCDWK